MNLHTKQKETQNLENKLMVAGGRNGGKGLLGRLGGHVHTAVFKMDNQQGPTL